MNIPGLKEFVAAGAGSLATLLKRTMKHMRWVGHLLHFKIKQDSARMSIKHKRFLPESLDKSAAENLG